MSIHAEMSQATYLQDMMTEPEGDLLTGPSEIASFYAGRNVLLTGGSGFLGRLLIDKILRYCPDVNTIFLFLREKKGKSPQQRFKELFDDVIFTKLHKERPNFAKKVVLIEGDMAQVGLGLSAEDKALLRNTHIIIHGAATLRFNETMKIAVGINVRGTKELLSFAEEMPDLKAFVYISTAFCNCVHHEIDEIFYPPPIDSEKLLHLIEILDDAALDHLTPVLLGKWPNTYAFTKAVAEDVVRRSRLPMSSIVRPSIVIGTSKEPVAGWINNVYGPTGVVVGSAIGLLRTLHCDENLIADLIPADYVVNSIIVAAWNMAKSRNLNPDEIPEIKEPPIFNVVSSCENPITWGQYMKYNLEAGLEVPTIKSLWFFCFKLNKSLWVHNLYVLFLHLLPAVLIDSLARLAGREPMLWKAYEKIHKFSGVIENFTTHQWRFHNNNTLRLGKSLSQVDHGTFDLDVGSLDWEEYYYNSIRGIRVFLLDDPLDTVPAALAKYFKLKVAHYTVATLVLGFLLWLLWTFLRFIVSW